MDKIQWILQVHINNTETLKDKWLEFHELWHCRLSHIGKWCIKIHFSGLKSIDLESLDTCKTCPMENDWNSVHRPWWTGSWLIGNHTHGCAISRAVSGGLFYFISSLDSLNGNTNFYLKRHKTEKIWVVKESQREVKIICNKIYSCLGHGIELQGLASIQRVAELFYNFGHPEHHEFMECPSDIIQPCFDRMD